MDEKNASLLRTSQLCGRPLSIESYDLRAVMTPQGLTRSKFTAVTGMPEREIGQYQNDPSRRQRNFVRPCKDDSWLTVDSGIEKMSLRL